MLTIIVAGLQAAEGSLKASKRPDSINLRPARENGEVRHITIQPAYILCPIARVQV